MARRRMIDPNIWQSEDFACLSTMARLIFIGLFSQADDEGRGRANPVYIRSTLFTYDKVDISDIEAAMEEIKKHMSITFYTFDDKDYYCLDNWGTWQTIEKPKASKLPAPDTGKISPRPVPGQSPISPRLVVDESGLKEKKLKEKEKIKEIKDIDHGEAAAIEKVDVGDDSFSLEKPDEQNANFFSAGKLEEKSRPPAQKKPSDAFAQFWEAYPRKVAKGKAQAIFVSLIKKGFAPGDIIAGAEAYAAWCARNEVEPQFIAHPTTWLHAGRWSDELIDKVAPRGAYEEAQKKQDEAFARLIAKAEAQERAQQRRAD